MAKHGILKYNNRDGKETIVTWTNPDGSSTGEKEYCGANDPVKLKYAGGRYNTSFPSSASVTLLVEDDEQREFLEDIFNGGYTITIEKEETAGSGTYYLLWKGRVTPMLNISQYKNYPYEVTLNCNDGIKEADQYQFLMIDFNEPWPKIYSVLDVITKYIQINLPLKDYFTLNVAARVYKDDINTVLEDIYVDPRVFMNDDSDEYIPFDKVINSLLGPLQLQLLQWKGEWWLIAVDAQYLAGQIRYTKYLYDHGTITNEGSFTNSDGILPLYTCEDPALADNSEIEFIPAWKNVKITQDFQINTNLFPSLNRTGNFYYGHEGILLDFAPAPFNNPPINQNLIYWDGSAPTAPQRGEFFDGGTMKWKYNAGALFMVAKQDPIDPENNFPYSDPNISYVIYINENLRISKFRLNVSFLPEYKGVINATSGKYKYKRYIQVRYVTRDDITWQYWNRWYDDGNEGNWITGSDRIIRTEEDSLNIEDFLPNEDSWVGGHFIINIYEPRDEHAWDNDGNFGGLITDLAFSVTSSTFVDKFVWEDKPDRKHQAKMTVGALSSFADPVTQSNTFIISTIWAAATKKSRYHNMGVGTVNKTQQYVPSDFNWEDEISVDINPVGNDEVTLSYLWGLHIPEIDSFHELHLSSPYDASGNHIGMFFKDGETGEKALLDWLGWRYIDDNVEYTTKLSGKYISSSINPLQLVSDIEDRTYKFIGGTFHDKDNLWEARFIEFKDLVTSGDFNNDFNNDFYL